MCQDEKWIRYTKSYIAEELRGIIQELLQYSYVPFLFTLLDSNQ